LNYLTSQVMAKLSDDLFGFKQPVEAIHYFRLQVHRTFGVGGGRVFKTFFGKS